MEIISDWLEAISDWDIEDFEQAFMLLGLLGFGLFGLASLGYRIYAFFFPEKGPFPWEDGWGEEETPCEDEPERHKYGEGKERDT